MAGEEPLVPVEVGALAAVEPKEADTVAFAARQLVSAVTNCQCHKRPRRIKNITMLTASANCERSRLRQGPIIITNVKIQNRPYNRIN